MCRQTIVRSIVGTHCRREKNYFEKRLSFTWVSKYLSNHPLMFQLQKDYFKESDSDSVPVWKGLVFKTVCQQDKFILATSCEFYWKKTRFGVGQKYSIDEQVWGTYNWWLLVYCWVSVLSHNVTSCNPLFLVLISGSYIELIRRGCMPLIPTHHCSSSIWCFDRCNLLVSPLDYLIYTQYTILRMFLEVLYSL